MRKGSKEAKAWGAKMKRLRGTKTRKTTTRKRRTTRKGDLTLKRTKAYRKKLARVRKRVFSRRGRADNWSF